MAIYRKSPEAAVEWQLDMYVTVAHIGIEVFHAIHRRQQIRTS
jgi:hypothetical protein